MTHQTIWPRACAALLLAGASWGAWAQAHTNHAPAAPGAANPPAVTAGTTAEAVRVTNAWARASVPGQKATGAFMTLTAATAQQLVGVASPVAGVAEVQELAMQGDVMRMRAIPALALPTGTPVELKPGGHHLMLMDLKQQLKAGQAVPVTLTLRDEQGRESRVELQVPVQAAAAPAAAGAAHGHKH